MWNQFSQGFLCAAMFAIILIAVSYAPVGH